MPLPIPLEIYRGNYRHQQPINGPIAGAQVCLYVDYTRGVQTIYYICHNPSHLTTDWWEQPTANIAGTNN
jgi:hypothetical protein